MIGGGEILRAVATSGSKTRKQKFYSTSIDFALNSAVGLLTRNSITFEKNTFFLWTGCVVTCMRTNFAGTSRILVPSDYLISFDLPGNGKRVQLTDQYASGVYSDRINELSSFQEYSLFEGNEVLGVNVTNTLAFVRETTVYVSLVGIEYRT